MPSKASESAEEVESGLSETGSPHLSFRRHESGRGQGSQACARRWSPTCSRVRESIAEIDSIGVQVKDIDAGLLDFPCRLDDQVVLLCWRMGEPSIEHWHTVDSGFQGRQPVDERFRRRSASGGRPN